MKKFVTLLIIALFCVLTQLVIAGQVPTIDKDELKAQLGSESLVILDVRLGRDWSTSEFKIQDAVRVNGKDLSVASNYSKDHTFVLYCA